MLMIFFFYDLFQVLIITHYTKRTFNPRLIPTPFHNQSNDQNS